MHGRPFGASNRRRGPRPSRAFGLLGVVLLFETADALAGGFEIPDNGTQALGRGAAFVAKADDATAIYHNPGGLARQRGTHLLFNGNLFLHSFEFRRLGQFPDDPQDPETPWGNSPYPAVKNVAGPFFLPFAAVTTDFGTFDRLTVGAGVFGPPTIGNRTFQLGVENKPAASRYDYVQSRSTMLFPTASVGFRVARWLDIGASGHLVLSSFDHTGISYADVDAATCKNPEFFRCDVRSTVKASGTGFGATLGAILRPVSAFALGASFRTPIDISATGTVTPENAEAIPGNALKAGPASVAMTLPWMLRVGGRYIGMDADFEVYDLELDVTYEGWGSAQAFGPLVDIPDLGAFKDVQRTILHGYTSTFGVRGGGAYNIDTGDGIFSLRGGAYFDSSATDFAHTRLDHDTLAKVSGTVGLGFKIGSFGIDVAYAAVASIPRTVGSGVGAIAPVNDANGGATEGADGKPLPAVNEGAYRGFTHILSLGVTVSIETLFGPARKVRYGNPYEPNYVPESEPERPRPAVRAPDEEITLPEKVPEEKPPEEKPPPPPAKEDKKPAPPPKEPPAKEEKRSPVDERKAPADERKAEPPAVVPPPAPAPAPPPPPPVVPVPAPDVRKKPPEKPPTRRKEWWEPPE